MTTIVAGDGIVNMFEWDITSLKSAQSTSQSSTDVELSSDLDQWSLIGTGFGTFDAQGLPHSGTLTGMTDIYSGLDQRLTFTDADMPMKDVAAYVAAGNTEGFQKELFRGNDTVIGGKLNDTLIGWAGNDTLSGGAGDDKLYGGRGTDHITGGSGSDLFMYLNVKDSTSTRYDVITGFDFKRTGNMPSSGTGDVFNVTTPVNGIDPIISHGHLSAGAFDAGLAAAVNASTLHAHDAVLFTPTSGKLAGDVFLIVDANGHAGYQAGHDLVIQLVHPEHLDSFSLASFYVT